MKTFLQSKPGRATWCCLVMIAVIGCDRATKPSVSAYGLTGTWTYSFSAVHPDPCPIEGLRQGCGGGGELKLVQSRMHLTATGEGRGGGQTCGMAWDWGGPTPVEARLTSTMIQLTINQSRFRAPLPPDEDGVIRGTMSCGLDSGVEAQGTWTMRRVE